MKKALTETYEHAISALLSRRGEMLEERARARSNLATVSDNIDAVDRVKNILKAELKRKGVSYRELAERLTLMGTPESERNPANKIARGTFTAAFFVQCLSAIGVTSVRLDDN